MSLTFRDGPHVMNTSGYEPQGKLTSRYEPVVKLTFRHEPQVKLEGRPVSDDEILSSISASLARFSAVIPAYVYKHT